MDISTLNRVFCYRVTRDNLISLYGVHRGQYHATVMFVYCLVVQVLPDNKLYEWFINTIVLGHFHVRIRNFSVILRRSMDMVLYDISSPSKMNNFSDQLPGPRETVHFDFMVCQMRHKNRYKTIARPSRDSL